MLILELLLVGRGKGLGKSFSGEKTKKALKLRGTSEVA